MDDNKAELPQPSFRNTTMKLIPTVGVAIAIAAASGLTLAESSQAPLTRAEVKAETRALQSAHKLAPAGRDGINNPLARTPRASTKTQAERKAEVAEARANGELQAAGDARDVQADRAARAAATTTVRAERRAETRAAEMAGRLTRAGEAGDVPRQ
jgi:hypothetical protein